MHDETLEPGVAGSRSRPRAREHSCQGVVTSWNDDGQTDGPTDGRTMFPHERMDDDRQTSMRAARGYSPRFPHHVPTIATRRAPKTAEGTPPPPGRDFGHEEVCTEGVSLESLRDETWWCGHQPTSASAKGITAAATLAQQEVTPDSHPATWHPSRIEIRDDRETERGGRGRGRDSRCLLHKRGPQDNPGSRKPTMGSRRRAEGLGCTRGHRRLSAVQQGRHVESRRRAGKQPGKYTITMQPS